MKLKCQYCKFVAKIGMLDDAKNEMYSHMYSDHIILTIDEGTASIDRVREVRNK